jgi:hypothetical protein
MNLNLPSLSAAQIEAITAAVADFIAQQRWKYLPESVPLTPAQAEPFRAFFPASILEVARFVELMPDRRISNPLFYGELKSMGFSREVLPDFAEMAAVTFVDVIVSYGPISDQTRFHELVHAVQYQKLGIQTFSSRYVSGLLSTGGYDGIPLECNAHELDARFKADPSKPFSVESEVQSWIDAGRF